MKKRAMIILMILTLCVSGCGPSKYSAGSEVQVSSSEKSEMPASSSDSLSQNRKDSFDIVPSADYTDNIKSIIETSKKERGFVEYVTDKEHYIFIFAGEKKSGGYDIEVMSAYDKGDEADIVVKENIPQQSTDVTDALTYPVIVIKVTKTFKTLNISTDDGEKIKKIEDKVKY